MQLALNIHSEPRARFKPTVTTTKRLIAIGLASLVSLLISANGFAQEAPVVEKNQVADAQADKNTFEMVKRKALTLSSQEYSAPKSKLPEALLDMTYSQYRNIRFDPQQAIWKDKSNFELQLFHPGFLYQHPVMLRTVDSNAANDTVPFKPDYFIYENDAKPLRNVTNDSAGFAGFRVHFPLNKQGYKDELAVFLGASYFRIVGPNQVYGISARGLAINTAHAKGEEFPAFTHFWIMEPEKEADNLVIYALLDSESVTGAYRFELSAALQTQMQVQSVIFARKDVDKLGIAPLTSMYLKGETSTRHYDDFRPEVHDSDGLLMLTSQDEQIWRQLSNPKNLQVTSMQDTQPKGFGLLQRDTEFSHYMDTEANYHARPGIWVTPDNEWGKGRLELVEIPTQSETHDNIVSYWVPAKPFKKGQSRTFDYTLTTTYSQALNTNRATVLRSMNSWAALPGQDNPPAKTKRKMIIDFSAQQLGHVQRDIPMQAQLQINGGQYEELVVQQLPDNDTWRVSFNLIPETENAVDMRLHLALRGKAVSEVWNYVWSQHEIE